MSLDVSKRVISFHYHLKDTQGQTLDQSTDGPLSFLTGTGQIIPKLENEVSTLLIGQKKTISLSAADAYGELDPKMVMEVPRPELSHLELEIGGFLQLNLGEQLKMVRIAAITDAIVTLDGNHPLAGQDLVFEVEMLDSRPATAEEVAHGHSHGPGGHQH
jgi:FKBP-type peptidyl-prolyl cis-trans isomerase SlyD